MELRKYQPRDCAEMARLFYDTFHTVNAADYTKEQLDAWADGQVDLEKWNASFLEHDTLVAVEGEKIVCFGDMDSTGYLDRLYVHKDYQRQGIASGICDRLEAHASPNIITTHASITAKPFFQKRGYHVAARQTVKRHGILLTNFIMKKE